MSQADDPLLDAPPGDAEVGGAVPDLAEPHDAVGAEPPAAGAAHAPELSLPVPSAEIASVDRDVFARATVVSIAEVSHFLSDFIESQQRDRGIAPHPSVQMVLHYCQTFAPQTSQAAEERVRKDLRARIPNEYHLGQVLNLRPETVDELKLLIPQLNPSHPESPFDPEMQDDDIQQVIDCLESVRDAAI